jgi:anti-sigma factor RsiW
MTMDDRHHIADDILLRFIDGELTVAERTGVAAHLDGCDACAARRRSFAGISALLAAGRPEPTDRSLVEGRVRLRARLDAEATRGVAWPLVPPSAAVRWAAVAMAAAAAVVLVMRLPPMSRLERLTANGAVEAGALPLPALTPGSTVALEARALCASRPRVQEIAAPVRLAVLRAYAMEHVPADEYELDYLITPELGGAPDARNLWPQRYAARVWNAGVKDQLEDLLPRLVCDGRVDLRTAQHEIAADWVAAYRKYFQTATPLPPRPVVVSLLFTPGADPRPVFQP